MAAMAVAARKKFGNSGAGGCRECSDGSVPGADHDNDPGGTAMRANEITEILDRPISRELLARDVTRLAYVAKDGTPRNVPIACTWNGSHIVMCTTKNAPNPRGHPRAQAPETTAPVGETHLSVWRTVVLRIPREPRHAQQCPPPDRPGQPAVNPRVSRGAIRTAVADLLPEYTAADPGAPAPELP